MPATVAAIEAGQPGHVAAIERLADVLGAGLILAPDEGGQGFYAGTALSSAWDAWATPQEILDVLYPVVGGDFDLDPCSPGRGRSGWWRGSTTTRSTTGWPIPGRGPST